MTAMLHVAKWCAYALVLLLPGSFVVLALLWLYRRYALRNTPVREMT